VEYQKFYDYVKDTEKDIRPDLHKTFTAAFPKETAKKDWGDLIYEAHKLVGLECDSDPNELVRNWGRRKKDTKEPTPRGSQKAACIVYYWLHFKHKETANKLDLLVFGKKLNISVDPPPERLKPSQPSAPFEWPLYVTEGDIKAAKDADKDTGIWLNPYNHHTIKLSGREQEKQLLTDWMEHDQTFAMLSLIGPSGAGKTRLVSQWMRDYLPNISNTDWDAGIVRSRDEKPWFDEEQWSLDRDILIVIDYSYHYGSVINTIKERALAQKDNKHKVRLLVLDHVYPENKKQDPAFGQALGDKNLFDTQKRKIFTEHEVVEIKPEKIDSSVLRDVIASVATHLGRPLSSEDETTKKAAEVLYKMGENMQDAGAIRHPLFAALMGQAIAKNESFENWTRRDLIERYFERGERIPWEQSDHSGYLGLGKWIGAYVCVATLQRGIPASTLEQCDLPKEVFNNQSPEKKYKGGGELRETISQFAMKLVSADPKNSFIKPYEPDILGESFLLMFLGKFFNKNDCQTEFLSMLQQLHIDKTPEQVAVDFAEVITRLCRNLANDDQSLTEVQRGWENLEQFLQPNLFKESTPLRHVVAISRIEMIWQWQQSEKKQPSAALSNPINPSLIVQKVKFDDLLYEIDGKLKQSRAIGLIRWGEWDEINFTKHKKKILNTLIKYDESLEDRWPSFSLAAYFNCKSVLLWMLGSKQFDINTGTSKQGWTALMAASQKGRHDVAALLIEKGANVNQGTTWIL